MNKKLIFVTGKGGTGKSTVSLYLARKRALAGARVLVVEVGHKSSLQHLAQLNFTPEYKPQSTPWGFDVSRLNGLDCLVDYVGAFVKVESLTKYFFNNPVIKTLFEVAPGLEDLAILGKLTSGERQHGPSYSYDQIIVDSPSTGSFTSMLQAPKLLADMVSAGPLHTQGLGIDRTLSDEAVTHTLFVSLFEKLPMEELVESTSTFSEQMKRPFSVLFNKKLPDISSTKNDTWSSFINEKIERQKSFYPLIQEKFSGSYYHPLITGLLADDIQHKKSGEDIFPPMSF